MELPSGPMPVYGDIVVFDTLDERYACGCFHGRSPRFAIRRQRRLTRNGCAGRRGVRRTYRQPDRLRA